MIWKGFGQMRRWFLMFRNTVGRPVNCPGRLVNRRQNISFLEFTQRSTGPDPAVDRTSIGRPDQYHRSTGRLTSEDIMSDSKHRSTGTSSAVDRKTFFRKTTLSDICGRPETFQRSTESSVFGQNWSWRLSFDLWLVAGWFALVYHDSMVRN